MIDRFRAERVWRAGTRAIDRAVGRLWPLRTTLGALEARPFQLGLEFTNVCNANCVFCPYQHQRRAHELMSDRVFEKGVADFVALGGGEVELTPIVGDPLSHPDFVDRVRHLRAEPRVLRLFTITNGILIDRHGVGAILGSGLDEIYISTAGFDAEMYRRVYRSNAYERVRRNVLDLLTENNRRGRPVRIFICLRGDRPLAELMRDPDFGDILAQRPLVRSNRTYGDAGGRLRQQDLPGTLRLRVLRAHAAPCASMFWGPTILADGTVVACGCVAAMDAEVDLGLGHILRQSLAEMWHGERLRRLRESFGRRLNPTCASCTMYQPPGALRTGRVRAHARRMPAEREGAKEAAP